VVIADRLAGFVNEIYNAPENFHGYAALFGIIFFSFQIYCDFSGYSDIAIGAAKTMGYDLMKNFNRPYFAKSIPEFWSRWHISLSTWFRDYLYIPLGGNRMSTFKRYRNVFIVFLISGLWHGANWTYIVWGALHGIYQMVGIKIRSFSTILENNRTRFKSHLELLNILTTFCLVTLAWIYFRATNFANANEIILAITDFDSYSFNSISKLPKNLLFDLVLGFFAIFQIIIIEWSMGNKALISLFCNNFTLRFVAYFYLFLNLAFLGAYRNSYEFIYFQF
jgi:D-alanyl-lipoteichoic acid acyltransferase DltB (MBOAT superfamily)